MKKAILLLLVFISVLTTVDAQTRKERKAERRAVQDSIDNANYIKAVAAIQDTLLILEADQAYDKQGNMVNVQSSINFVKIEKDRAVVQLAFPFLMGPNGVGGITLDGRLTNYEVKTDKKGRIHLSASSFGSSLTADIRISLSPQTNRAEATVTSATLPYAVRFTGELNHTSLSTTYEGTPRF